MLSEPAPTPPPLPPPVRTDTRLEIEPDEQWKDDLRKRIEYNLRNMVEDAQIVRDTILNSQPSESSRERALQDYEKGMTAIRELAQEEFTLQLRLEMSAREWALYVVDSNSLDITQQQQRILNTQKAHSERIPIVPADASYDTAGALSISPQQQGGDERGSDESFEDRSERFGSAGSDDEGRASDELRESGVEEEGEEGDSKPRQSRPPSRPDSSLTQSLHSKSPVSRRNAPSCQRQSQPSNNRPAEDNDETHRPSSGYQAPSWRPDPRPPELSGISRAPAHASGQMHNARPAPFPHHRSVNRTGSTSSGAGLPRAGSSNSNRYRSSSVAPPTPSGAELPPTHSRDRIAMPLGPTTPDEVSRVASWGSRIHLGRSLSDFNTHRPHNSTGNSWLPPFNGDYSGEPDGVVGRLDDRQSRVIYDPQRLSEAMRQRTAIQRRPTTPDEVSRVALWGPRIHLGRTLTHCNTHRRHDSMGNLWVPPADGTYSDESDDVVGRLEDRQSMHSVRSVRDVWGLDLEQMVL